VRFSILSLVFFFVVVVVFVAVLVVAVLVVFVVVFVEIINLQLVFYLVSFLASSTLGYSLDTASTLQMEREDGVVPLSYSQLSVVAQHSTKDTSSQFSAALFQDMFVKLRASTQRVLTKRTSLVASADITPSFDASIRGWSVDAQLERKIGADMHASFGVSFGSESLSCTIG